MATGAFPPAGIALAALLRYGSHLWPGIFVGEFLLGTPLFRCPNCGATNRVPQDQMDIMTNTV